MKDEIEERLEKEELELHEEITSDEMIKIRDDLMENPIIEQAIIKIIEFNIRKAKLAQHKETKQKMIEEFKEMIDKIKVWEPCGDGHSQKKLAEKFKKELKSQVEKGK